MDRRPGLRARMKLTLSYAGFLVLAGVVLLAAEWVFITRVRHIGLVFVPAYEPAVLREFAPTAAVVLMFLLVFGLAGGWLLAGRMLAPLTRITEAARLAAEGSLSHRIRLPGRQDEFRELADAFDTMLAQIEAHVGEQQRFAADASHELRTPLAITQTLLEVASKDPDSDTGELIRRLRTVNDRAIDLTEALLLLSRAGRGSFTREPVDLSLIADEVTETLLPLAEERGVSIETSGEPCTAFGSAALLLQVATNLVHNAIVHSTRGRGAVWVRTSAHPDAAELTVSNTGEQLAPSLVSTLVEPFRRGSGRARTDHPGAGLGLAIVKSIVDAHGGAVILTPRPAGGLCVSVRLPVPARAAAGQADPEAGRVAAR